MPKKTFMSYYWNDDGFVCSVGSGIAGWGPTTSPSYYRYFAENQECEWVTQEEGIWTGGHTIFNVTNGWALYQGCPGCSWLGLNDCACGMGYLSAGEYHTAPTGFVCELSTVGAAECVTAFGQYANLCWDASGALISCASPNRRWTAWMGTQFAEPGGGADLPTAKMCLYQVFFYDPNQGAFYFPGGYPNPSGVYDIHLGCPAGFGDGQRSAAYKQPWAGYSARRTNGLYEGGPSGRDYSSGIGNGFNGVTIYNIVDYSKHPQGGGVSPITRYGCYTGGASWGGACDRLTGDRVADDRFYYGFRCKGHTISPCSNGGTFQSGAGNGLPDVPGRDHCVSFAEQLIYPGLTSHHRGMHGQLFTMSHIGSFNTFSDALPEAGLSGAFLYTYNFPSPTLYNYFFDYGTLTGRGDGALDVVFLERRVTIATGAVVYSIRCMHSRDLGTTWKPRTGSEPGNKIEPHTILSNIDYKIIWTAYDPMGSRIIFLGWRESTESWYVRVLTETGNYGEWSASAEHLVADQSEGTNIVIRCDGNAVSVFVCGNDGWIKRYRCKNLDDDGTGTWVSQDIIQLTGGPDNNEYYSASILEDPSDGHLYAIVTEPTTLGIVTSQIPPISPPGYPPKWLGGYFDYVISLYPGDEPDDPYTAQVRQTGPSIGLLISPVVRRRTKELEVIRNGSAPRRSRNMDVTGAGTWST
jgi:hypothetical protein